MKKEVSDVVNKSVSASLLSAKKSTEEKENDMDVKTLREEKEEKEKKENLVKKEVKVNKSIIMEKKDLENKTEKEKNTNAKKSLSLKNVKSSVKNIDVDGLKTKGKEKAKKAKEYYMNNTKKCVIGALVVVFGIAIINKSLGLVTQAVAGAERGLAVTEITLDNSSIENDVVYAAKIEAKSSIPVILKTSGEVKQVYVSLGDRVKEGDVLFTLDEEDLRKNVNALNAQYNAALAGMRAAKSNYDSAMNGSIDINVIQSKSQRDTLYAQYSAAVEMHELGAISDVEFEQLKASYEAADKSYNILLESGVNSSKEGAYSSYEQAQAACDQAKIALDNARDLLADARVKAPIDGVVASLNVKEKTTLSAGMTPCTVVNADELEINLSVSESVISLLAKGDSVNVTLNSFPGEEFTGIIDGLSSAAGNGTGTYPLVIKLENPDGKVKSGMFGKVTFETNKKENVVVIPRDSLITLENEKYVFIEEDNKAKKVVVTTGIDNGKEIEITSGLKAGDKLITDGQDYLEDGDDVRVVEG